MISLSTGLPGAGKTLYTITYVKDLAEKENRQVFYSGIKDLSLDWQEIEPEKWSECPPGAIVVIDECQRIFRPRRSDTKVPAYVSALETHRHNGLDIFLITQHPMLMDASVRRLTERHWHICRRFGMQRSSIFQFESCKDQPLTQTATAQRLEWSFPRQSFDYYKSAEVHTVKRRLPMQYYLMFIIPLIFLAIVWYIYNRYYTGKSVVTPPAAAEKLTGDTRQKPNGDKKSITVAEYLDQNVPRVTGLAYTAPIYDKITEPDEAPVPVACLSSKARGCKCYSQQATLLDMPQSLCQQIVEHGFFRSFGNRTTAANADKSKSDILSDTSRTSGLIEATQALPADRPRI